MNLFPFTLFSQKIPGTFLRPTDYKVNSSRLHWSMIVDQILLLICFISSTEIITANLNNLLSSFTSHFHVKLPLSFYLVG